MRLVVGLIVMVFLVSFVSAISWNGGTTYILNQTIINGSGGAGNVSWNQSFANDLYVNADGDTMTGNLDVTGGNNISSNLFKGLFNWIIGSSSEEYIQFNGSTLDFNESKLNTTVINIAGSQLNATSYTGADFSGSSGDENRQLNIGVDTAIIEMERNTLRPDSDYDITSNVLTIYLRVFDQFRIRVISKIGLKAYNYLGSDLSGTNPNKYIAFTESPVSVILERQSLISGTDYTFNDTAINFDVYITDQMRLTIWT